MHHRYFSVVATIAAGATIACSDAAVNDVTAPRPTVTPAAPVTDQWPTEEELAAAGVPNGIGIQISSKGWFEDNYRTFVAEAQVHLEWVNEASARLSAALLNEGGSIVNSSAAHMGYKRIVFPVSSADTTFTVRLSTNNVTCGLLGKHSVSGRGALMALDVRLVTILLYEVEVGETNGADVSQPACPPKPPECDGPSARVIAATTGILASESADCEEAPAPPTGGVDDLIEVCYIVWRELWIWDWTRQMFWLAAEWPIGVFCYYTNLTT